MNGVVWCPDCGTKADKDTWNRIMDTATEDQLRAELDVVKLELESHRKTVAKQAAELLQKTQQLEQLKHQCDQVITDAGCWELELKHSCLQIELNKLKGML